MKQLFFIIGLLSISLTGNAAADTANINPESRLVIKLTEFPADKLCAYKNEIYTLGSKIKMSNNTWYRCERLNFESENKYKGYLKWVEIKSINK